MLTQWARGKVPYVEGLLKKKREVIEAALRTAVQHCERVGVAKEKVTRKLNEKLKTLREQRRAAKHRDFPDKQEIKDIQKEIQKQQRTDLRIR